MEVYETNDGGKIPLTWSKIKNMPLTHRVWYLIYTCMVNAMQKKIKIVLLIMLYYL
jgi:hypothetical protein